MTINSWLIKATKQLQSAGISSPRLDALLFLSDIFQQDKSWILTHSDTALTSPQLNELDQKLHRRAKREPMAYIRGYQEFFGREFIVTPDVLIPRPETETLIEVLKSLAKKPGDKLIDIGTGSGCIAITAKLEMPLLDVYATDISTVALSIAKQNASSLNANIHYYQQNLLVGELNGPFAFIVANLPYVADDWQRSPETNFEPAIALFADGEGLQLIKALLRQSVTLLQPNGYLLLEADPRQYQTIIGSAPKTYKLIVSQGFALVFQRRA